MLWIDGASRRAYAKYNDCLSFDTTYMTNMYKMSCAPFIGINNHGQSIQFGCGFIRNELKENFVWLFNTFLHAMGGVAPKNIITDQDFAMRSAIDEVFLNIIHRNCRWHIMKKAQEKLGKLMADDKPLNKAFKDCRQQLDWYVPNLLTHFNYHAANLRSHMNICDAQVTMCGSTQVTVILLAILPGAVTYVDTNLWFRKVTRSGKTVQ